MAYYLTFPNNVSNVQFGDSLGGAATFEIECDFAPTSLSVDYGNVYSNDDASTSSRNALYTRSSGEVSPEFIIGGSRVTYDTVGAGLTVGVRTIIRVVYDGSTLKTFADGTEVGSAAATGLLSSIGINRFGNTATGEYPKIELYRFQQTKNGTLVGDHDPSASNGTGLVLPDVVGANDGALINFPTTDIQWTFYLDGPALTVTQSTLTPGGTISGTYAEYDTVPTTLTVSDGTNTITIPTPTITDNGDGTGSFSGTMPALPTTGTANLVLFGDVTVELS